MNKIKILIVGNKGLLGESLMNISGSFNYEITGIDLESVDISDTDSVRRYFEGKNFDWLVNCAAYTDVDGAEVKRETAMAINAKGPENLATICKEKDINFLHISTDMVFTGIKEEGEFNEDALPNPVNFYGLSKLEGEKSSMKIYNSNLWIVRTSWLYGGKGDKRKGFVNKVIDWASKNDVLSVVDDEIGSPTFIKDLSYFIFEIIADDGGKYPPGIYHAVNLGEVSRYEVAEEINKILKLGKTINRASIKNFNRPAKVSHKSILKNTKLPQARHWKDALREYLGE